MQALGGGGGGRVKTKTTWQKNGRLNLKKYSVIKKQH
jgi:hypothetical protein